ncbi:hypothetical protein C1646_751279 [Rhizophagus diaphanus]|nr:hypothetical protein C1646_751279 [Rhizophagus diaphanus] [Rhizophagus sp. MUCL 43196]
MTIEGALNATYLDNEAAISIPNDAIPNNATLLPTSNYIVVMDYANKGNLRSNLKNIIENKNYIYCKQKLIHDFHDGNILYHKNKED